MELPFAVDNHETDFLPRHGNPLDANKTRYDNVTSNSSASNRSSGQQLSSHHTTRGSSNKSSSTSYQPINQYGNVKSITQQSSNGELLRGAVLYDNVRPHFYNVRSSDSYSSTAAAGTTIRQSSSRSVTPTLKNQLEIHKDQQQQQSYSSAFEDDFVTIDADDDTFTAQTTPSVDTNTIYNSYHLSTNYTNDEFVKSPFLFTSKTNVYAHGHPVDILSLLLNTVTSSSVVSSSKTAGENIGSSGTEEHFMTLCQKASNESKDAARAIKEGEIVKAIQFHVESSKKYRDAAILLKKGCGSTTWSGDVKFLAYSLLLLSNAQARSADCLMNSAGGCKNLQHHEQQQHGNKVTPSTPSVDGRSVLRDDAGKNDGKDNKEGRLRAKIRASMNTAEADMTDSTFLGKATRSSHPPLSQLQKEKDDRKTQETDNDSSPISLHKPVSDVNPVDDMMELEKELRDMDATLNMGLDLSASTSSIMTKKTLEDGSFCVVPGSGASAGGSSYMSSSIMWASSVGGRQTSAFHGHAQQQNTSQAHQGRVRANRVQSILGASSMGIPRPLSMVGNQHTAQSHNVIHTSGQNNNKQHPGLESSWWGQASALASSTTSLSNSMVGIRSANIGANQSGSNATALPANPKQLMRLLDSLKTLGDENASLLREVEDAKKARMEAKAARETMRQFKEEYNKRFATLKAALDKFRAEYPDHKAIEPSTAASSSSISANNIITKSNFVRNNTLLEMQKRDKMIQKLTADLRAERAEGKKKDDALRKYENFYKEVKARSEQKKRQKEEELKRKN
jgi:hypothetical protein